MIPKEWLKTQGEGSVVGVIDTGINPFLDCFHNVKMELKYFGKTNGRHGTHVVSTILQFAPKTNVIFAGGCFEGYEKLENMLEWMIIHNIDVLNLSLSYNDKNDKIEKLLHEINSRGTIVVAAFNSKMTYPCKYPFVLKAGNGGEFEAAQEWVSYFHDGSKKVMRGSSVSAAITSGLCSLGRAFDQSLTKEKFLSVISPKDVFFEQNNKKQVNVNL